jgi:branched-chain amino acid transport system permease protein
LVAQQIVNGLALGSIYAMVAIALTLSIGVINFLNFSIPGLFMVGGFGLWVLHGMGFPWPAAFTLALIAGGAIAFVVERFTWRWMKTVEPFVPLVSSMAFLILFENLAVTVWGSDLKAVESTFLASDLHLAGLVVSIPQLIGLAISLVLACALWLLLARTSTGHAFRTISEDPETARILGIDVNRMVLILFIASGVFAALAGLLFAVNYRQVNPFMGEIVGLKGISAMVIGGMGNVWGAILGGLLIGLTEVAAIGIFGADFVDIAVYGLLLSILAVRPTGLLGSALAGRGRV